MAAVALLSWIFALAFDSPPLGRSFALFYATGYLPFAFYSDLAQKIGVAMRFSKPLLSYPALTWADTILARFLLNAFTHFGIILCVLVVICTIEDVVPANILLCAAGIALASLCGMAFGTLNTFLFEAFPVWERIWAILNRPAFIVSGEQTDWLADQIVEAIPTAQVFTLPNRGRDILPFVRLINAGALDGPADFGFYDLRLPKTLAAQAALAGRAGIDAFCVYHYWFGGKRLLEEPLDRLLTEPDIDFPFYLCWANESWRRNWDGLSGEVLVAQDYKPDFETDLVASTLPYMRDARYQRPDGQRPRFVVYRPSDLPAPEQNIARMRRAWRRAGIGEVEIGAVAFHVTGEAEVAEGLFDFWIEMPPHGLVKNESYVFGGAAGNLMNDASPVPGFSGVIYDYSKIAQHSVDPKYRRTLPSRTIAGIMPSWDNTARRKVRAHIARGGSPATFRKWLREMHETVLETSYRNELFINAWNEWGEKAMLEPSQTFGHLYLDVLAEVTSNKHGASVNPEQVHA
eukprot:g19254.t1